MSKLIFVVLRSKIIDQEDIIHLKRICTSLAPDNIVPNPSLISYNGNIALGIINPTRYLTSNRTNLFFGQSFGSTKNWDRVEGPHPDGNYALFRSNEMATEIVSDVLGTKSVWYYHDDEIFLASTSQRAIVRYLGNFEFNEKVIPWMLCNGLLGPGHSWDRRIKLLEPDTSIVLDRINWEYKIQGTEVHFQLNNVNDEANIEKLKGTLEETFNNLNLDYSQWKLSLSGGYDSRGNLCLLPKKDNKGKRLETVTWGTLSSEKLSGTDSSVAKRLAEELKLQHVFMTTGQSEESLEVILNRFLKNGEGRIDHIGGYIDGFKIWKSLFENGITGIIRGDEVFGSYNFISDFHLKKFIGLSTHSDYENLKDNEYLKSFEQIFPKKYIMRQGETWAQWRDRLYQSYLVPIYLSGLADLKEPYVEQLNPLLSRKIVNQIRQLPDHLRTDKRAFRAIVDDLSPNIGYAYRSSTSNVSNVMKKKAMVKIIQDELNTDLSRSIFNEYFLNMLLTKMIIREERDNSLFTNLSGRVKSIFPKSLKRKVIGKQFVPMMDFNTMAFRAFIIVKMNRIFEEEINDHSK